MECIFCKNKTHNMIYRAERMPLFQNKVYCSYESAQKAFTGDVTLLQCSNCGYAHNSTFDSSKMQYDKNYQNEQAHSDVFKDYLNSIIDLLKENGFLGKKIIEIGCGKGYFLNELWKHGFDAIGFDPAYEGNDSRIIKDYFSQKYSTFDADLIILRHTLEHIENPVQFIKNIPIASSKNTKIYIEVPSFEWIIDRNAFWDIFFEHCNYFSSNCLCNMFEDSKHGLLFNGQYQYVIGTLNKIDFSSKEYAPSVISWDSLITCRDKYKNFINDHQDILLWGAGAKAATFLNFMDPDKKNISAVIDINPKKQHKYIAKTGHKIIPPKDLYNIDGGDILVMNENYINEIEEVVDTNKFQLHILR